jgi:hypothetical protein
MSAILLNISDLSLYLLRFLYRYVLGIDEAEAFSKRLKREFTALEAANVHAILESSPLVEVYPVHVLFVQ